jgi:hypothetical protein
MTSTVAGIQIDVSDEQPLNASISIRFNLEPDSNVNEESEWQPSKHFCPMTSTVAGMQVDCNEKQALNAHRLIWVNFEPDWKVNKESDRHIRKLPSPITSTAAGMQIDWNDGQKANAYAPISFNLEPDSNVNESDLQREKDAVPRISIVACNTRSAANPKYRRIETQSKSIRQRSVTIRCSFSG